MRFLVINFRFYQIDHFPMSNRFRSCLLDARNQRGAEIGLERDHHRTVTNVRLRVAFTISRRAGDLRSLNFANNRLYDSATARQWESYLVGRSADTLSNSPKNIDMHWAVLGKIIFSGTTQDVGHVQNGRYKIWLTGKSGGLAPLK